MALFERTDVDKKFYNDKLKDFIPDKMCDVHTHVYLKRPALQNMTWSSRVADQNSVEDLIETADIMFPGKLYVPVMFGSAGGGINLKNANRYVSKCAEITDFPSLMLTHPDTAPDEFEVNVIEGGFWGIKVYLTFSPSYIPIKETRIFDFLTPEHLEICNKNSWIVMLHIPRTKRLRDELNIAQLLQIEKKYKNLKLIVAHVGRAYCNSDIGDALDILSKTKNMVFDFSANTNSWVFEKLIKAVGSSRILFGSDLPITRMRMKRIEEDGHYVNIIPKGLYGDVSNDKNMKEIDYHKANNLTFFMYEEIEAFRQAAIKTNLSNNDIERIFWLNAKEIFRFNF